MTVAAAVSLYLQLHLRWDTDQPRDFAYIMFVTVTITTISSLLATLLTSPEPQEKLIHFYRQVRPEGPGWKRIATAAGLPEANDSGGLAVQFVNWGLGCVLIYASLFGIGKLVFKEWGTGLIFSVVAITAGILISRNMKALEIELPS